MRKSKLLDRIDTDQGALIIFRVIYWASVILLITIGVCFAIIVGEQIWEATL